MNKRNYKENLKKYNLKKPKREASTNEHVGLIFIFDSKEELEQDDLQQQ
jgi:hypothetical protein